MKIIVFTATLCLVLTGCLAPNGNGLLLGSPNSESSSSLSGTAALDSEELLFVSLINDYRALNSLSPLQVSVALTESSDWMSSSMANQNYFSHTDSLGRDPFTRMEAFGYDHYTTAGENIAAGNATAQDTFTQWKNSPAHNANMLSPSYRAIGVGRAYQEGSSFGWYWTTDFGSTVDQVVNQAVK